MRAHYASHELVRCESQSLLLPRILYERVRLKVNIYGSPAVAAGSAPAPRLLPDPAAERAEALRPWTVSQANPSQPRPEKLTHRIQHAVLAMLTGGCVCFDSPARAPGHSRQKVPVRNNPRH